MLVIQAQWEQTLVLIGGSSHRLMSKRKRVIRSLVLALIWPVLSWSNSPILARQNDTSFSQEEQAARCQEFLPLLQREAQQHPYSWGQQEALARQLQCLNQTEAALAIIRAMPALFPSLKSQSYYLLAEALYIQDPNHPELLSAFLATLETDFSLKKRSEAEKWSLAYFLLGNFHRDAAGQENGNREVKLKEARAAYEKALEWDSKNLGLYRQFSSLLIEQGNETKAAEVIRQGLVINPDTSALSPQHQEAMVFRTLGSHYRNQNQRSSAIQAYEKALKLNSNIRLVYEVLGQLYAQDGQFKKALKIYLKASSKDTSKSRNEKAAIAYSKLGQVLQQNKDWSGAIKAYRAKMKRIPVIERWEAESYAFVLIQNNQEDEALGIFQKFFQQSTQQPLENGLSSEAHAQFALGHILARLERFESAKAAFAEARQLGATDTPNLGYSYSTLKRKRKYKKAIALFEDFSQHYTSSDYARYLATLYSTQQNWEKSLDYAKQSIQLERGRDSTQPLSPQEEAQAYIKLGNWMVVQWDEPKAEKAFQKALSLDENAIAAWNALGHLYWDMNQLPEAIQSFEEVLKLDNQYPLVHNSLGLLLAQTGNEEDAIAFFKTAAQLSPTDLEPSINLEKTQAQLRFKQQIPQPLRPEHQAQMEIDIESTLGLAGLNKGPELSSPSPELFQYRQQQTDQTVAPYLGNWIRQDYFPPFDVVNIFPSKVPGRICILSQKLNHVSGYSTMGDIVFPNTGHEFSVVNLNSTPPSALAMTTAPELLIKKEHPLKAQPVEFLGLVDTQQNQLIYTAKDKPIRPKYLSSAVLKQWQAYGCKA